MRISRKYLVRCLLILRLFRIDDTFYRVIGGKDKDGAVVISQFDGTVDYSPLLCGRVANLVPVDDIKKAADAVSAKGAINHGLEIYFKWRN